MIKKNSALDKQKGPTELFNERQETIFDTELSIAADNFTKAVLEMNGWKKKKDEYEKALIVEMHRAKLACMNLEGNRQIRVAITLTKEKIVFKDLKAKTRRMPRRF